MPDLWLPGAERRPVGNTAPMNGGPPRATWHATSNTNDWSYHNESAYFAAGGAAMAPHLIWDPFSGQVCQYFPANSRALALKNASGEQTNRTGRYNVQIEVVFTPGETVAGRRYPNIADTPCTGLDRIMAWLRSLGVPDTWPGGAPRAWARQTVSLATWRSHGGHYGHCHVPGNDHIDPGPMPDLTEDDVQLSETITVPAGPWNTAAETATVGEWISLANLKAERAADNAAATLNAVHALAQQVQTLTAEVARLKANG